VGYTEQDRCNHETIPIQRGQSRKKSFNIARSSQGLAHPVGNTERTAHGEGENGIRPNHQQDNRNGMGNDVGNGGQDVSDTKTARTGENDKGIWEGTCGIGGGEETIISDTTKQGLSESGFTGIGELQEKSRKGVDNRLAIGNRRSTQSNMGRTLDGLSEKLDGLIGWGVDWEEGVPRVAVKVPARVDRLKALGNAIVPQVVAVIMQAIKEINELDRP
jgi:hypothetical protein